MDKSTLVADQAGLSGAGDTPPTATYWEDLRKRDDYWRVYLDFWGPLIWDDQRTGRINLDALARELFDYYTMMNDVSRVYDSVTFGKISKPNTDPRYVIQEAEQRLMDAYAEGRVDGLEEGKSSTRQDAFKDGFTAGRVIGKEEGYAVGYAEGGNAVAWDGGLRGATPPPHQWYVAHKLDGSPSPLSWCKSCLARREEVGDLTWYFDEENPIGTLRETACTGVVWYHTAPPRTESPWERGEHFN